MRDGDLVIAAPLWVLCSIVTPHPVMAIIYAMAASMCGIVLVIDPVASIIKAIKERE